MIAPGAVWAMYVRSLPGFGTWGIWVRFIVVETSPFSAWSNGISLVTLIVALPPAISSVMLRVPGGPSSTLTSWLSSRKPACETLSVYFPGARKKNRYTPSPSVLAVWIVPLDSSLSSTTVLGTTAWLGSLTTPVKPPEAVVWAHESWIEQRSRERIPRSWIGSFHLVEAYLRFQANFPTSFTTCERSCNTTAFLPLP